MHLYPIYIYILYSCRCIASSGSQDSLQFLAFALPVCLTLALKVASVQFLSVAAAAKGVVAAAAHQITKPHGLTTYSTCRLYRTYRLYRLYSYIGDAVYMQR